MYAQTYSRLDEERLTDEISNLDSRIAETNSAADLETKCVLSYLKQLLRNKRRNLATVRYQRKQNSGKDAFQASAGRSF